MNDELILIVDDNLDNLDLTRFVLEYEGFEVLVAEDAQQALRMLKTCSPRLILMDVQMPGMDGHQLTRRLRQDPAFRDVRIVALTAYAMLGDEEKARSAGCDGYITKPIDTRTFADRVRGYLEPASGSRHAVQPDNSPHTLPGISDLVCGYLEGKRADAGRIHEALHQHDFETIRVLGHNLKGTGAGYGFAILSDIGRKLESAAKAASAPLIESHLAELSTVLQDLDRP